MIAKQCCRDQLLRKNVRKKELQDERRNKLGGIQTRKFVRKYNNFFVGGKWKIGLN